MLRSAKVYFRSSAHAHSCRFLVLMQGSLGSAVFSYYMIRLLPVVNSLLRGRHPNIKSKKYLRDLATAAEESAPVS